MALVLYGLPVTAQQIDYYPSVHNIIINKCSGCHKPNQSAPFSLLIYEDVLHHSSMIDQVTTAGYMPPWKADTLYSRFSNEKTLTAAELLTLKNWIAQGKRKGIVDSAFIKKNQPSINSQLGKPDITVALQKPFTIPAFNKDTVVFFKIPFTAKADTNVAAFEFVPGNAAVVHHSNSWVYAKDEEVDEQDVKTGTSLFNIPFRLPAMLNTAFADKGLLPKSNFLYYDGWVPGASSRWWPKGFGFRLPKEGYILLQIHYAPTPVEEKDLSLINIFYTHQPITRPMEVVNVGSNGGIAEPEPELILQPDSVQRFEVKTITTRDLSYLCFNPHMHYLGKEMKAYAVTPDGDTIKLISIKDWDFRWQEFYVPEHPIKIPANSVLHVEAVFDNRASNPANRNNPPKKVVEGANTTDEMMSLIIFNVPYEPGDEKIKLKNPKNYF